MRSVFIQNKHKTSSAAVLCYFYDLSKGLEVRANGGLHRAAVNVDELKNSTNADLRKGIKRTHRCGWAAEGRHRFLFRIRMMQRPESMKMRGSMAAAELEQRRKEVRGRRRLKKENGKGPRSRLFIRKDWPRRRKKRGDQSIIIQRPRRLDSRDGQ